MHYCTVRRRPFHKRICSALCAAFLAATATAQVTFTPRLEPTSVAFLDEQPSSPIPSPHPSTTPQDLTALSLEDLLHQDITPINVLGSHTHLKGGFMIGYRYMYMDMEHNQLGTHEVSVSSILKTYPVAHTSMTMQMHMLEAMYAPLDTLTFMVMVPYLDNEMKHETRTGPGTTVTSTGIGDVQFMALYNVLGDPRTLGNRLLLNAGFSAPSGSITETAFGKQLEYSMQLGSGTWDFLPGLTYLGESERFAWGSQVLFTIHNGFNDRNYHVGDRYRVSAWLDYKVFDWFGPSVRLDWHAWDKYHGADPDMDPARNPAFDPNKLAGARLDFMSGLNFYVPEGFFKGNRFSFEGGVPVYQNINGPNMAVDWIITAAWSWTF
jgi:hypothetical protein